MDARAIGGHLTCLTICLPVVAGLANLSLSFARVKLAKNKIKLGCQKAVVHMHFSFFFCSLVKEWHNRRENVPEEM